jgi:hypothetical protein
MDAGRPPRRPAAWSPPVLPGRRHRTRCGPTGR